MEIFKLVGSIIIDDDKAKKAIDGTTKKAEDGSGKMMNAFNKLGGVIATVFAVDKIKDFFVGMVNASADMMALNAQFEQVFGDVGDLAEEQMNAMGDSFGMLPNRLKAPLTSMTSMFKGLGYSTEEAMQMATDGVTMAADASAFYDISLEEANGKLNSFIKGNYEGGEAIGLFANETQMASFASDELGLNWKTLDEAGKQLVRLEYAEKMMENSGATGQASRESEGLENVLGNLKQAWTDFMAILGEPALELVIPVMQKLAEWLATATTNVTAFFDSIRNEEGIISGLKEKLSGLFSGEGFNFDSMMSRITEILPQMVSKGQEMIQSLISGILANLPALTQTVVGMIQSYINNLGTMYPMLLNAGVQILVSLINGIVQALPQIASAILTVINTLVNTLIGLLPVIINTGISLLTALINGIIQILPQLVTVALQAIQVLVNGLVSNLPLILSSGITLINALVNGILTMLPTLMPLAIQIINTLLNTLLGALPQIISAGVKLLLALINGIVQILPSLVGTAMQIIARIVATLLANLPQIISAGIRILVTLASGLVKAIPQLIGVIPQIISSIKNAFSDVDWGAIGKGIIQGIAKGIGNFAGILVKKGKEVADNALGGIKKFLGINSPSRLFRDEVGKWIPAGIAVGIEENGDLPYDALNKAMGIEGYDFGSTMDRTINHENRNADSGREVNQNITINSPKSLNAIETARQFKKANRQLALGN